MKTLTEMLSEKLNREPMTEQESIACELRIEEVKSIFKDWLKTVGLPVIDYTDYTENTRKLLVALVDEP